MNIRRTRPQETEEGHPTGDWIRHRREALELTQTQLGRRVGVSQNQISLWERGKALVPTVHREKLAAVLGPMLPEDSISAVVTSDHPRGSTRPASRERKDSGKSQLTSGQVAVFQGTLPAVGRFASFLDDEGTLTVGKVLAHSAGDTTLEVFRSPVAPEFERVTVASENVEAFAVPRQALVYQRRESYWAMGRTVSEAMHGHFAVRFPNTKEPEAVPIADLFVRSPRLADDPTTLLAGQVTSSPYFTEARHRFTEFVASQRATYRGLTALPTAGIELHLHQLAAVNRVLSDPVHRYLLADEVGLGKTIEAGLLIAQHLVDEGSNASVVLVAPEALVEQWKSELVSLFGLKDDPRLRIFSFADLDLTSGAELLTPGPTLAVVDEAHLSASWAFPSENGFRGERAAKRYRILEALARCPKLLLLSGTPVLHHEDGFLAMLHLLEPETYSLNARESFRTRVAARVAVGDALSQLTAEYQDEFLTEALTKLSAAVDSDEELTERIRTVRDALDSAPSKAVHAIEELRSYLLERYRLHRRIIRTHRESKAVANLLPRRSGLKFFPAREDRIRERAFEALDDWRSRVVDSPTERSHVGKTFGYLLSNALSHPSQLGRAFGDRAVALRTGDGPEFFEGEASWLSDLAREFVTAPTNDDVRASALADFLRIGPASQRRAVVFVDAPETANLVVRQLSRVKELEARVLSFSAGDARCVRTYQDRTNAILVCDRSAEEGLNLQRYPATIVFYDLPFDIGRIEQRIGRFDRLEGMKELSFRVVEPVGPYERGWARLLAEHVRIFDRSVARLQYVLSDALTALRSDLIEAGPAEAFESVARRFADPKLGLDAELKRLRRQEALDATEWQDDEHQLFVERVSEKREASSDEARDAIEDWLKELQFDIRDTSGSVVYTHVQMERGAGGTLVPLSPLQRGAKQWIKSRHPERTRTDIRHDFGPFVFVASDQSEDSSLLGLGHPFFDTVFECMRADDRSRSWAMWRHEPHINGYEFYIRFDFSIEASLKDLTPIARRWKTGASLRRRADSVLPVEHRTVWMDIEGTVITERNLLTVLERPYARDSVGDKNLNAERWMVANRHVPVGDWGARILRLRRELEQSVRGEEAFQRRCKAAEDRITAMEQHATRILRSRAAHVSGPEREALEDAIRFESELGEGLRKGVQTPVLRVDNVGAILLAPAALGR
jgi:ATP-dependent helicase HepA